VQWAPEYEDYLFSQWERGSFDDYWRQPELYAAGHYGAFDGLAGGLGVLADALDGVAGGGGQGGGGQREGDTEGAKGHAAGS